jgi:protein-disulfide isomerase
MDFTEKKDQKEKEDKTSFLESSNDFDGMPLDEPTESWEETMLKKKVKNLTAILMVVAGLFVGSLYVDIAQLVTKSGFSSRALSKTDIVSAAGKTWVAYDQPVVRVTALTDETCEKCQTDEALVWLRRIAPTISVEKLDVSKDKKAKEIAESAGVLSIPAFVFSKEIAELSIFEQARQLFKKLETGDEYALDTAQVGIPVGKYLELPEIGEKDIKMGSEDAPVRVVEFTDFQCPFCKTFHETLQNELKAYGDKVLYVFKQYPISSIHPQAEAASLASECANEQGKFTEYADTLFSKQDEWGKTTGSQKFKDYARTLKLDTKKFNACVDEKKYQDKVTANMEEGKKFGISGTPGTFVNGTFLNGAISKEELQAAINVELGTNSEEEKKD